MSDKSRISVAGNFLFPSSFDSHPSFSFRLRMISNVQCRANLRSIFQVHPGHSLLKILRRERASALSLADAPLFFFYRSSAAEEGEESKKGSPARMHACMWDHVCVRNTRTYTKMSNRLGLADGTVADTHAFPRIHAMSTKNIHARQRARNR